MENNAESKKKTEGILSWVLPWKKQAAQKKFNDGLSFLANNDNQLMYQLWKELPFLRGIPPDFNEYTRTWEGDAVVITNAVKEYKSGTKILNDFNLVIPRGKICVICGHSGSGKSTLIKVCSGLSSFTSGQISVLGSKPGTGLPGSFPMHLIGLMPQSYALYRGYTAYEFLHCFGRIYGMSKSHVEKRIKELSAVVELYDLTMPIKKYSGGQQRRISFMAAILHEPKFIILDEPTVGLDSILRKQIWDYLAKCTHETGMSVLVSTHYINEARRAHKMCILRNGNIVLEGTYEGLRKMLGTELLSDGISKYFLRNNGGCDNLGFMAEAETTKVNNESEEEFPQITPASGSTLTLNVCPMLLQESSNGVISEIPKSRNGVKFTTPSTKSNSTADLETSPGSTLQQNEKRSSSKKGCRKKRRREQLDPDPSHVTFIPVKNMSHKPHLFDKKSIFRIAALCEKNFLRIIRSLVFLCFTAVVPCFEVGSLSLSFGNNPTTVDIGYLNMELKESNLTSCPFISEDICSDDLLSCKLMQQFPNASFRMIPYDSEEEMARQGKATHLKVYFVFNSNFSSSLKSWFLFDGDLDDNEKKNIFADVRLDEMDRAYASFVLHEMMKASEKFVEKHLNTCHYNYKQYIHPLTNRTFIMGDDDVTFRDFAASSLLLVIIFFFPMVSSCIWMIEEKLDGTFDRAKAAGVTIVEYYLAQTISETLVILFQTSTTLVMLRYMFDRELQGNIGLILVLCVLVGWSGLTMGYLINLLCSNTMSAMYASVGTFFPTLAISGCVWPLSASTPILYYLGRYTPISLPAESIRSIINRGWTLTHFRVWPGFVASIAWIFFVGSISTFFHKRANR